MAAFENNNSYQEGNVKPETREMLDRIDDFLVNDDIPELAKSQLWDVLSALRGPDEMNKDALKSTTTIPIRRAAFPKMANYFQSYQVRAAWGNETYDFRLPTFPLDSSSSRYIFDHFILHVTHAARTLGILTDETS